MLPIIMVLEFKAGCYSCIVMMPPVTLPLGLETVLILQKEQEFLEVVAYNHKALTQLFGLWIEAKKITQDGRYMPIMEMQVYTVMVWAMPLQWMQQEIWVLGFQPLLQN